MTHLISKNKIIIDEILHGEIEETNERNQKERERERECEWGSEIKYKIK